MDLDKAPLEKDWFQGDIYMGMLNKWGDFIYILDLLNYVLFSGKIEKKEESKKEFNKYSFIYMTKLRQVLQNHEETFNKFLEQMKL